MDLDKQQEHILVCLSTSPSNAKIVETAAKMAYAFGGMFTALYVKTPNSDKISDDDRKRLQYNLQLAEQLGATVTTVYGDDVSYQIAEFARLSRVTKIVVGRSSAKRRRFLSKPTLTDRLSAIAPNIDVHIIPDYAAETKYDKRKHSLKQYLLPSWKDILITALILAIATGIGMLIAELNFTEANIITVYILSVLLTALFTKNYVCNVIGALASVLMFNFLFIEPRFTLRVNDVGTYFTFAIMLIASLITGTLANRLQNSAKQSAESAYRTKVLFDTNQLLQNEKKASDVLNIVASQLMRLLNRDVIAYSVVEGKLIDGRVFRPIEANDVNPFANNDAVANWISERHSKVGTTADSFTDNNCIYLSVAISDRIYGVVGIFIGEKSLDSLENSILQSILGECALAIDNIRNAEAKESAAMLAQHEQLRANLLRAISHDLRTPLTSISGNADYLLNSYDKLDADTRTQVFTDIYDDSMWLFGLVENLLSVTRIEEGNINLNLSCELVEEIIEEALRHINRRSVEYNISVDVVDKLLMAKVDVKLVLQVLINLVDNAIKYTPAGTDIVITAKREGEFVRFLVADNGDGVPDNMKNRVFDMFYTGDRAIADSRRSLGLGLALCKSIVTAHGGEIVLKDNEPHGSIFTFTVPISEINIYE